MISAPAEPRAVIDDEGARRKRRVVYRWLIGTAIAWMAIRLLFVAGSGGTLPFISANDRSRWCTIRALVDEHTYEIDNIITQRGWDTIDKVSHYGRDGEQHYYSSKPTLLPSLLAIDYWLVRTVTGFNLAEHPFVVGRFLIFVWNAIWLLIFAGVMVAAVERWGTTDWGRIYVIAVATWGTFLFTFGVTLNNHLPAAAMAALAFYGFLRIWYDEETGWRMFALTGLAAAFLAANELPALAALALFGGLLLLRFPGKTLIAFTPPVLLVGVAFFGTNYLAHDTIWPAYTHRVEGENWERGNWYNYPGSYWTSDRRSPIDQGEPSVHWYRFHVFFGHHGIFSLTPVWLLSAVGCWWLAERRGQWMAALVIAALATICLVFFIQLRPVQDRNYGGATCGFRWMFWQIPLWLVALIPVADQLGTSRWGRRLAWVLFAISAFSAAWGWFRPWMHPWVYVVGGWWEGWN